MLKNRFIRISFFFLIAILLAASLVYLFRKPLLKIAGSYLIYEDPLQKCDAGMILAGEFPDRTLEAGDLFKEGYLRYVIMPNEIESSSFSEIRKRNIPIPGNRELAEMVKKLSSLKYGRPREIVEAEIAKE